MDRAPNTNEPRDEPDGDGRFSTDARESTVEIDAGGSPQGGTRTDERHANGSTAKQPLGQDEVYCWSCGVPVKSAAEICPECGVRQQPPPNREEKNPGLAALASAVWVGAGQIYNGEIVRGVALMALMFISTLTVFIGIGLLTTPIVWVYAVVDAYRTADRTKQRSAGSTDEF